MPRALLTAVMALLAIPAFADEPNLGGYVGTLVLGPDHELYAPTSGKRLDQPLTASIGARAGLSLTPWFDMEGELEIGAWPIQGGTVTIAGMRVGPRFIAPNLLGRGRHIHLTAGVGNVTVMAPNSLTGTDVDFAAHIGPGVSLDVGRRISLRGDYRALITAHAGDSPLPSVQSLITVGISLRIGRVGPSGSPQGCPGGFAIERHCVGIDPLPEPRIMQIVRPRVTASSAVGALPVSAAQPLEKPEANDKIAVFADKILFEPGSWELHPASLAHLEELVGVLTDHPELTAVRVEGHTDDSGASTTNLRLSQARVDEVARVLIAFGIDTERVVAEGFGEARPLANNNTVAGRAANRRVEIHAQ
jgi:outer membrane protein OmpA-like peptidoglycan-associated protein